MGRRTNLLVEVVEALERYYGGINLNEFVAFHVITKDMHPFGVLVSIILTQNTSDVNALKALTNLTKYLGPKLTPQEFLRVGDEVLEELIRPSGMYRVKVRAIRELLKVVAKDPDILMKEEPRKLRDLLLSVKGVGPKTADVFLLVVRGYPTFPVDTHIRRVLYRLGVISEDEDYESIRGKVMSSLPESEYLSAHLLLITHGRRICRARKPKCGICPIKHLCRRNGLPDDEG